MRQNATLARLRADEAAIGLWLQLGSPTVARLLAAQGSYHWLLVDLEHTATDLATASQMMSFIADVSAGRVTPLARVPAGTIFHIKQVLDAGAQGVMVPMINTADEARDAVRFSRYPPIGERGVGGFTPFIGFGAGRAEYTREANDNILLAIQIETRQAVENIDAIASVPGIDVIFVGPNDLHISYGLAPRYWSDEPAFRSAIDTILAACKRHNIPAGTLCGGALEAKARIADGFTFVGVGSDAGMLLRFAGLQAGEVTDTPEPAGTWGSVVKLDR
ncbi:MAG: aldolase/citrate lyase family protein [Chloroflexota bacterium]|nr:aldolase/citrate lyase family protein [Chloroflexota bacterium]